MIRRDLSALGRTATTALIAAIALAMAFLSWFGFRSVREWRRSSTLLELRRTEHAADRFVRALVRDMQGVESRVLRSVETGLITLTEPSDLNVIVAGAFARYPYPEAFFAWETHAPPDAALLMTRAERPPSWLPAGSVSGSFPVSVVRHGPVARRLIELVSARAVHGQRFAMVETEIDGRPYQVIARLLYRTSRRAELERVFGFVVNLEWVNRSYLAGIAEVIEPVVALEGGLVFAVVDDANRVLVGTPEAVRSEMAVVRHVRPLFCDPALVLLEPEGGRTGGRWTVYVSPSRSAALALRAADWTITATVVAAVALGVALLLTGRALRASADLAKLRSDFVATVTHELKTPLATLRVAGETLSRGRLTSGGEVREYARIIEAQAGRLSRLVDNLLAYSRVTDVSEVYTFERLALADLVDDVLRSFQARLVEHGFEVVVDIPADLPSLHGDRTALVLAFDNLIDNAMRYSGAGRWIGIRARADGHRVRIEFSDRGIGIPARDLPSVLRRFSRGTGGASHGSGLGLPIVSRIVTDHQGTLHIESEPGRGTTVTVTLPLLGREP